jgi:hypothetical protein
MTFSYSGNPSSSSLDLVRFLLQDTDSTDVLLSNEEINYLIATWTNPYEVARVGAETISGQFTRLADSTSKSVADLSISKSYSNKAGQYRELAIQIANQRARLYPSAPVVNANSLKGTRERTFDSRKSDFYVGIDDNRGS